jgi:hypothetical protein|tara:strand:- start:93 stop:314 length:222 start_codon:yes stop_codon:yes gene_type:complete
MVPQKYLVVNGGFFYDSIKGFKHEPEIAYQIKIRRTQIYNPTIPNGAPMEASIYRYELLEILFEHKDEGTSKN